MKKIVFVFFAIILILTPVYSSDDASKGQCFQQCQSVFRNELAKCRANNTNTAIRTACLDNARVILNECLDTCRDKYPDKIK